MLKLLKDFEMFDKIQLFGAAGAFSLLFFFAYSSAPRAHPSFLVSPDLSTWPSGIWRTEWRAQSSCAALTRLSPTSTASSSAAASPPISKFAGKQVRRLAFLQIAVYTRAC